MVLIKTSTYKLKKKNCMTDYWNMCLVVLVYMYCKNIKMC